MQPKAVGGLEILIQRQGKYHVASIIPVEEAFVIQHNLTFRLDYAGCDFEILISDLKNLLGYDIGEGLIEGYARG